MSHLDICSMSYGKKKGRESNCQFDSRPIKVGNRPNPSEYRWSVTHHWKALDESYKFSLDLVPIEGLSKELWLHKMVGVQTGTSFGIPPWESRDKKSFGCRCRGEAQRVLYGGKWWLPPSPSRGESCESRIARGLTSHQDGPRCEPTNLWLVGCKFERE
jgi:hypothetical protein